MKEDLQSLLKALRTELGLLEAEKRELGQQLTVANSTRRSTANKCLSELLPDLEMGTIRKLQDEVPGFPVPLVPTWLGFSMKVDPSVTVYTLRMQLGTYIDNSLSRPFVPRVWKDTVVPLDSSIRGLQDLIRANSERLSDVNERIRAVEKLLGADLGKMDPKIRAKVEQAVKAQVMQSSSRGRPYRFGRNSIPMQQTYPATSQIHSDSGPDLLEMWFWYQLLTPNTEVSHEVTRIEGGGGEFGGAGASGDFSSDGAQPPVSNDGPLNLSDAPDIVATAAVADAATGNDSIETQYDLGAGNFS